MYRNDIGWIDFVWGSTGILKANGKPKVQWVLATLLKPVCVKMV